MTTSVLTELGCEEARALPPGRIRQLPDAVVNQIKAGEVVERPLSVVKELVENALDANATQVRVDLFDGGKSLIRITDNGVGMSASDALLCLQRHATSKIESLSDLDHIATFGFRGEALASIAAVSEFTLRTRRDEDAAGTQVVVDAQANRSTKPVAAPVGTQIEVAELFSNTPARRKFLKSAATEYSHIHEFMQGMALAYPHVGFSFHHNRRVVFEFRPAPDLESRARALLGPTLADYLSVAYEKGSFSLAGFAGHPAKARSVPQHFLLFINGRLVRDRVIRAGVLQAYSGLVMKGLLPSVVLFVQCDPSWVDVNAHPNKTEVRFCDPAVVQDLVCLGLTGDLRRQVQSQAMPLPAGSAFQHSPSPSETNAAPASEARFGAQSSPRVQDGSAYQSQADRLSQRLDAGQESPSLIRSVSSFSASVPSQTHRDPVASHGGPLLTLGIEQSKGQTGPRPASQNLFGESAMASVRAPLRYLGQFQKLYLLFENQNADGEETELWVVDQHAFHERILYECFVKADKGGLARQQLLTPHFVVLPPGVGEVLAEHADLLLELGFECEWLPDLEKIAVHAFPAFLDPTRMGAVFDEVVVRVLGVLDSRFDFDHPLLARVRRLREDWLGEGRQFSSLRSEDVYQLMYATMACHAAVRAGQDLSPDQVRFLVDRASDVDFSAHCPHGRPVIRRVSLAELSGWFART